MDYPITERLLKETIAAVLRTPGHFFAGVQASDGGVVESDGRLANRPVHQGALPDETTVISGRRPCQLHRDHSLSSTKSSGGSRELAFVSYTTGSIERGFNDDLRYDILAARPSWRLALVMWLATKILDEGHRLRNLAQSNLQGHQGVVSRTLESF